MAIKQDPRKIYLEIGQKKAFAVSVNWPGWARSGQNEDSAIYALWESSPRYAKVLSSSGLEYHAPESPESFDVIDRLEGNATTDFGAPDAQLPDDWDSLKKAELGRLKLIMTACWKAFDHAAAAAEGKELQKGPRGGGRELTKIIQHVVEAEEVYLRVLGYKSDRMENASIEEWNIHLREETLKGLDLAISDQTPREGPRIGKRWPPRFFIRRVAWHVLDHAWEIEDRVIT